MRVSKKQAAQRLGISIKTLDKRMRSGQIKFEKDPDTVNDGWKGHARVWIFLPDAVPVPCSPRRGDHADVRPAPQYDDEPVCSEHARDRSFAEAYLAGELPDSSGNYHGTVQRKSLLGPTDDMDRQAPAADLQSHMDSRLLGNSGPSERHSFDKGMSDEQYNEAMAGWRRQRGVPSMSEQREQQERSHALIAEAFNHARR